MTIRSLPPRVRALVILLSVAVLSAVAACATNPATGQQQLSFFGEAEEIQMGAEVDRDFLSNFRTYEDPALEAYVAALGSRLAAVSERPDLPWSFRIVDDEIINAFALPGGRIYVTRGLLAHLNREAELVGVLGHEIGHVTARHSVNALSRELAISVGVVAGLVLLEAGDTAELASSLGMGLLFLKFGRNQERQADQLGVRYAERADFDPHGVVDALRVLQEVSQAQGDGWFPAWLSTHPDPDRRWQRLAEETGLGPGRPPGALQPEIDAFLPRLDGLSYGMDPRNGVFRGNAYVQVRDGYQVSFPDGWEIEREGQTVAAASSAGDAMMMLLPQPVETHQDAAAAFAQEDWVAVHQTWDERLVGLPARVLRFGADLDDEQARGIAAFVHTGGGVVAVIGLSSADTWPTYGRMLEGFVRSIGGVRGLQQGPTHPDRLQIVTLDRAMTVGQIARHYSPHVDPSALALLNHVAVDQQIPAGRKVKVVRRAGPGS